MIKRLVSAALCAAVVLSTATSALALDVVTMFGPGDGHEKAFLQLVQDFQKKSGVSVTNNSTLASEAWRAAVITDFNTGNEPDVIFTFTDAQTEVILDKVVPVETIKAAYPDYAKDINAGALASAAASDGKAYAVPIVGFWEGLFTNKDMFDARRLPYPTSWDNFTRAIKGFAANNITPITVGFANEPHYLIEHMILSAAGVREQNTRFGTDISKVPATWVLGLDTIKTLADIGAFGRLQPASFRQEVTARVEFNGGNSVNGQPKAAMMFGGNWLNNAINDAGRGNKVQVFPIPAMPNGKGNGNEVVAGFSSGYYITQKAWADAAKQADAVKFVNFMTTRDAIRTIMQPGAAPAANVAMSGGTLAQRTGVAMTGKAATVKPVDEWLASPAWTEIWTNAINIANGSKTATEVLQAAVPLNQ